MFKYSFLLTILLSLFNHSVAQNTKSIIQDFFSEKQSELGFTDDDILRWKISSEQYNKKNQSTQVYIQQEYNNIPILNAIGNITLTKENKLYSNTDAMIKNIAPKVVSSNFPSNNITLENRTEIDISTLDSKPIYFFNENKLEPCLLISYETLDKQHYFFKVYDTNHNILKQWDQVLHCSFGHSGFSQPHTHILNREFLSNRNRRGSDPQYNVYAIPVESPNHGPRTIVSGEEDPTASPFGWHDVNGQVGPEYTTTRGNNVSAYEDFNNSNSQGYAPDGGTNLVFNFPIDETAEPAINVDAAITNLFYMSNFMHDFSYHYGFDEQSGNFQQNNYGNGGTSNDFVLAEAQDGGGTNNANFATLWDGAKPRMQMYVWEGSGGAREILFVNNPENLEGSYIASTASFGAEVSDIPISGDLVLFQDDTDPTADACTPAINGSDLSGKIALIDRGDCTFVIKVKAAQDEGAIAVVIVNNVDGPPGFMGGDDPSITIPSVMISNIDGDLFKNALDNGTNVNITLQDESEDLPPLDGDFDNGIIAHEYTHGISTRLVGGRFNAFCLTNQEQMGEGWSDYFALMTTINLDVANPIRRPVGTFVRSENPDQGFGIRPVPYDTSFAVNSYTYGNINNDEISIPHGVGFIWCTMLWDLTWALIDKYGYDDDIYTGSGGNNIAIQLVTDAMKLVNCNPGFVQSRNAILRADSIYFNGENQCLIWEAFAKRGLGFSASQGNPNNVNDGVEAFDVPSFCNDISAQIAFSANQTIVCDGEVEFTDETSLSANQWFWDFGDGNTSEEQNPTHTYATNGDYTVSLTVAGDNGFGTSEVESYITVTFPEVPANVFIEEPCIGNSILITADVEYGNIVWENNDEVYAIMDSIFTEVLSETSIFEAYNQIIVSGDTCYSEPVEIVVNPIITDFNFEIDGLEVTFEDDSNIGSEWLWDFGDGNTSTEQNPIHTYANGGTFEVSLTINNGECTSEQTIDLNITALLEQLDENYISISPNPASNFVLISLKDDITDHFEVTVYNAEGQEMQSDVTKVTGNSYQLDLSNWANGLYTVQLKSQNWTAQKSLIVTKN